MLKLFEKQLLLQKKLETQKRNLRSSHDYAELELFKTIDLSQFSYLDSFNLQIFLRKYGFTALHDDLDAIMRRMNIDGDSILSNVEFLEGIILIAPITNILRINEIDPEYTVI